MKDIKEKLKGLLEAEDSAEIDKRALDYYRDIIRKRRSHLKTIDNLDKAEEALFKAYKEKNLDDLGQVYNMY